MNDKSHPRWEKVSAALREAGVAAPPRKESLAAPLGFSTRVVSRFQADERANATGLALWRRWTLAGAACALLILGGGFLVKAPQAPRKPIIPVPAVDSEISKLVHR